MPPRNAAKSAVSGGPDPAPEPGTRQSVIRGRRRAPGRQSDRSSGTLGPTMPRFSAVLAGALGTLLAGCAAEPPSSPPPQLQAPPARAPATVQVLNTCDKDVVVHHGPQAQEGAGTATTLAANMSTTVPRQPDGTLAVWLVNKGAIAAVSVTARMTRVEIGKSCWTLDAK